MIDNEKTKEQLLLEISYLKQLVLEWEAKYAALESFAKSTEERFLNITSAVSDYIFSVHIVEGNPVETVHGLACYAITGYTPMEFYENPYLWINMVYPEDRALVLDHVAKILSGREVKPLEHRIIRKDGVIRWVRNTPVCQYDAEGKLKTYDGLIQDITEIKRSYDTLKLSEEKFAKAFRSSPDIITITSIPEGRFIDVNDAFVRKSGYSREEVIGAKAMDLNIYLDYNERAEIVKEVLSKGKVSNRELKIRTKRGDILVILASAELTVMGDEQCMITVARDITERKDEFLSIQQEKLLIEENLNLQLAQKEHIIDVMLSHYINHGYADLSLLRIDLRHLHSLTGFIEALREGLTLQMEVTSDSEAVEGFSIATGQLEALPIIVFRVIEHLVCLQADRGETPIRVGIKKGMIEISSDNVSSSKSFVSFTGRQCCVASSEYTLSHAVKRLLNGNFTISNMQEAMTFTLSGFDNHWCALRD